MKKLSARKKISVVVPVFGCSASLDELNRRLVIILDQICSHFEIILIDDGSHDNAWDRIVQLAKADRRVQGIKLSKNFGEHHAIAAGLDSANGDWIVVMACDLQDRPEEIPRLLQAALTGYDMVIGIRSKRKDSIWRSLTSKIFYRLFAFLTDSKPFLSITCFGIYSRQSIEAVQKLREQTRSFGLFTAWVGFNRLEIPVEHGERKNGRSAYTLLRKTKLALDSIFSYSSKLLYTATIGGSIIAIIAFASSIWVIYRYFFFGIPVAGWTSLVILLYLSTGLVIGAVGIVGIYVGKIFDEVKQRPIYLVKEETSGLSNQRKRKIYDYRTSSRT